MKSQTAALYRTYKPNSLWMELPLLLTFNLLLAASAYLSIDLPFSPVPITGQTFGVLLVAMALGRVRGTAIVLAYLVEGGLGLPVFAGGTAGFAKFLGPTGGYLIGFPVAAYLVGYLADRGWDRGYVKSAGAMLLGTVVIFAVGLLWLSRFTSSSTLLEMGLIPFMPGALVKIVIASIVLPSIWRFVGRSRPPQA